jgi:hypothetical protein
VTGSQKRGSVLLAGLLAFPVLTLPSTPTAIGRVTVKSPADMRSLAILNAGKKYADQLKPFNFLLTCHVKQFGHPPGADPERFHLIAPYELDPRGWLEMPWVDRSTGKPYRITTEGFHGARLAARVKTYGEVLREYEFHPGSKSADVSGKPCGKQTIGLLQRRHIRVARIIYIASKRWNLAQSIYLRVSTRNIQTRGATNGNQKHYQLLERSSLGSVRAARCRIRDSACCTPASPRPRPATN